MPFSDTPPPIVFPDTPEGWDDRCRHEWDGIYVYMCGEFLKDESAFSHEGRRCANRDPFGVRGRNLCYRCPAGYMLSREEDPYADSIERERLRF